MDNLELAVKTTAMLLDEHGPLDWRKRLVPHDLNFFSPTGCVFGQIFGEVFGGLDHLKEAGAIDFSISSPFDSGPAYKAHNDLTAKVFVSLALFHADMHGFVRIQTYKNHTKLRELWAQEIAKPKETSVGLEVEDRVADRSARTALAGAVS